MEMTGTPSGMPRVLLPAPQLRLGPFDVNTGKHDRVWHVKESRRPRLRRRRSEDNVTGWNAIAKSRAATCSARDRAASGEWMCHTTGVRVILPAKLAVQKGRVLTGVHEVDVVVTNHMDQAGAPP